MQKKVKLRHNEKGFMLLQAVTAIALSAIVSVGLMQKNIEDQSVSQAEIAGKLIHQYTSAVAEYTSDNNTTIAAGYNPVGANWLRTAATCGAGNGTGAKDYLPCSFPSTFSFGLTPNTLFTSLGGGKWSVTTTFGRILNGANIRMDLAEIAKKAAMGLGNEQATPLTSTTFHEYKVDYTAGVTEGTLLSVVNTNASTDAWLRTDGSNQMNANLNVGGNDVVNARDGIYSRNVSAGNNLTAANNVTATNDVNAGRSLGVGIAPSGVAGRIDANNVINTNQYVDATGHPGSRKVRLGGNVYSNVPLVSRVGNDLNIASAKGGTTRINWYRPGAIATRTGNSAKYQLGNSWALVAENNNGTISGAGSTPRSAASSLYVNDILLRSKNVWMSDIVNRLPTTPVMATQLVNGLGGRVYKPVCGAGGTPKIYVIPMRWNESGANWNVSWYAVNYGPYWQVYAIRQYAVWGTGAGPSYIPNARAITQLACRY